MEWINQLSDDQMALIGCFVAIVVSGGVMAIGNAMGQAGREDRSKDSFSSTLEMKDPGSLVAECDSENETRKKAA